MPQLGAHYSPNMPELGSGLLRRQATAAARPLPGMAVEAFAKTLLTGLRIVRKLPGLR